MNKFNAIFTSSDINIIFWLRQGALEEAISCVRACVCDIIQNNSENEFLMHSKESRRVLSK